AAPTPPVPKMAIFTQLLLKTRQIKGCRPLCERGHSSYPFYGFPCGGGGRVPLLNFSFLRCPRALFCVCGVRPIRSRIVAWPAPCCWPRAVGAGRGDAG